MLAEAGYPKGLKTTLTTTGGYGRDLIDAAQIVQRYLKEVGLEVELKIQEYGAYQATTGQGKFEGLAMGPYARCTARICPTSRATVAVSTMRSSRRWYRSNDA